MYKVPAICVVKKQYWAHDTVDTVLKSQLLGGNESARNVEQITHKIYVRTHERSSWKSSDEWNDELLAVGLDNLPIIFGVLCFIARDELQRCLAWSAVFPETFRWTLRLCCCCYTLCHCHQRLSTPVDDNSINNFRSFKSTGGIFLSFMFASSSFSVYTFNFQRMNEMIAGGVVSVSRDSKLIQMNDSTAFLFEIKSMQHHAES